VRKFFFSVLLSLVLVFPAAAQTGDQTPPKDPLSTMLRGFFARSRENLVRSAEKVPENLYDMRPGPQTEVRTFGQIIGHLANMSYYYCSNAKEEKNPQADKDFEKLTAKADLVKSLKDAFDYCGTAYASLTDASALQTIQIYSESGKPMKALRVRTLIQNISHNNEHYGNLVTYMRIKSILPPSSEPRP
jgi:uncharacterized damage-inducible protein DinB